MPLRMCKINKGDFKMSDFTNFAVYHIYPLGFCGCPKTNDYSENTENRLKKIEDAIPHIKEMGFNAINI